MTEEEQQELGSILWRIANTLRGQMNADDFRDYMLSLLFFKYLSDNYVKAVEDELDQDYPILPEQKEGSENEQKQIALQIWYDKNPDDIEEFEEIMRRRMHYIIKPECLWDSITELARTRHNTMLKNLQLSFKHIEEDSFESVFQGLFSEINLNSDKLGKDYESRNSKLCDIVVKIANGIPNFSSEQDTIGDAYEYLIGEFAAGSGKKAGEFYTPQSISNILSEIVCLDSQNPKAGKKKHLDSVFDMTCGSGSLLLNVRNKMGNKGIGRIYGQESNITTYNLARMNMLLHGVSDSAFEIFHGDTLKNEWGMLSEVNPAKKMTFDAVVANPPFSLRWEHTDALREDVRFKRYGGLAPKSAADFAFLLHGFHYLKEEGTMAIILPHGVLFRRGAEADIREKLLKDGHIDTVIGLPSNLFYSTGIPVCILVLKKCKQPDDVLFINASECYRKGKKQNYLRQDENVNDIVEILKTYRERPEKIDRYARRVSMEEIKGNGYNLNISRYVSTAEPDKIVDLDEVHGRLGKIEKKAKTAHNKYNTFLKELKLDLLPK